MGFIFPYNGKMENPPRVTESATLDKGLSLLGAIAEARGETSFAQLAKGLGLSLSTAHRLLDVLERHGHVVRIGRGRYIAGAGLARIAASADLRHILTLVSRPILRAYASASKRTVHLGVLEGDMVTYLVKEQTRGAAELFTREGIQLEAYCSGIGKVLLSALEPKARNDYLANGPFVPLTQRTITTAEKLRREFTRVRARGFAVDDREVADDLQCLAVPIRDGGGRVVAAISMSGLVAQAPLGSVTSEAASLAQCASRIARRIWPQAA